MFSRTKFLIFIYVFTSTIYSQTDSIVINEIPVEKGFANSIRTIFQDKEGYLWFAKNNIVQRYDGYNFQSYTYNPEDTSGINDASVGYIYEDKDSTLWMGTSQGLEKFDRSTNTFTNYLIDTSRAESSNIIYDMIEDENEIFWICSSNGIYKFDKNKRKFTNFLKASSDPGNISNQITAPFFVDRQGSLWLGTQKGLDKIDYKSGKYLHFIIDSENLKQTENISNLITSICQDSSGTFWLGTRNGLFEFNQQLGTFIKYLPDPERRGPGNKNEISKLCYMPSDMLWVGTASGLYIFNTGLKKFTNHYFGIHHIGGLCIDKSGILWAGTWGGQIYKILIERSPVKKYFTDGSYETVNLGNGIFWICTTAMYWSKFDSRRGVVLKKIIIPPNVNPFHLFLGEDNGDKWYNDPDKGIYKIDRFDSITHFSDHSGKKFTKRISRFCMTSEGIWFSVDNLGLYFLNFKTHYIDLVLRTNSNISVIYKDSFGILWGATFGKKFYRYNPKNDSLAAFISNPQNPKSISGRLVYDIHEDIKHRLWVATDGGLNRFERSTKTFIHYTEKDGLPGNSVFNILEDDHGNLWLNTNKGISKFNPETNQFNNYGILQGATFGWVNNFAFKASNGEMFFRRDEGLISFHPDSIKENHFIPPIVITSLQLFDKSIPFGKEIKLPYDKNFLSFEFAALSFKNPERNQYAYKMEGIDKDWVYSGTRRYASYPNLSPGEYVFRVKGSNNDGIWNEAGTSLLIVISPPWWQSTWAYICYGLIFVLAAYSVRRYELNRMNLKNQVKLDQIKLREKEETDRMKSRFFANISHEFRTPLTLITGPIEKILSEHSDEETIKQGSLIKRNTNRLLALINQLLDLSKLEAGKLQLKAAKGNIVSFIKGITMSFESAAERKDIELKVKSSIEKIEVYFDKDMMVKVFSNILSNAFKFTPEGGEIIVTVGHAELVSASSSKHKIPKQVRNDNMIAISIRDTGVGIAEEELTKLFDRFYQVDSSQTREYEGSGLGLALTKELVELHKGTIKVNSKLGEGSEFIIELPLGRAHLSDEEIVENEEIKESVLVPDKEDHVQDVTEKTEMTDSFEGEKDVILIIEDNKDVREYIKDSLVKNYHIEEAANGEQGVIKAVQIIPDLIISDIMMPKMDGNELTKRIKNDERTSHIPVILLTAKAEQQSKLEGLETGADDYLIKPFDTQELMIRIRNLISLRKRLQVKFSGGKLIFKKNEKRISILDEKFLNKVFEVVETHLSEENFSIEQFSEEVGMGRVQLHRKLKALTGKSASLYIRSIRLSKAKKLIEEKSGNISEIAYSVGFSSPAYFTACFKEEFGYTPSEFSHN